VHAAWPCLARAGARHPARVSESALMGVRAHLLPPEFCNVFEVDAACEPDGAIGRAVEDECEEMGQKPGLGCELVELLLCLFSGCRLERGTEQRGDVRHGHSEPFVCH